jgi:transposase-like protein
MARYNKYDVVLLEKVYSKLRVWTSNHPNVARMLKGPKTGEECINCGGSSVAKYGIRPTVAGIQQRWVCKSCGKHYLTKYRKAV